jgi:hypothetical protein
MRVPRTTHTITAMPQVVAKLPSLGSIRRRMSARLARRGLSAARARAASGHACRASAAAARGGLVRTGTRAVRAVAGAARVKATTMTHGRSRQETGARATIGSQRWFAQAASRRGRLPRQAVAAAASEPPSAELTGSVL